MRTDAQLDHRQPRDGHRSLKATSYHYRSLFANGASHCDSRVQGQTLSETLLWLWRGYPIP